MTDDSARTPFYAWIPIESTTENETAIQLSSDSRGVELVFVNVSGRGTVHHLSRDEFACLLTHVAGRLGFTFPRDVR